MCKENVLFPFSEQLKLLYILSIGIVLYYNTCMWLLRIGSEISGIILNITTVSNKPAWTCSHISTVVRWQIIYQQELQVKQL